jgi:hypothetical protein
MGRYPAPHKMVLGTTVALMLRMVINRLIVAISTTASGRSETVTIEQDEGLVCARKQPAR